MKKIILILFLLLSFVSIVGCDSANIEIGANDGVAYFNVSSITPDVYLIDGNENIKIEDEYLFGKLVDAINEKTIIMHDDCDCQPTHSLKIKDYKFALHSHGILVTQSAKGNVKHINYIGFIECDEQTMNDILSVIESVMKQTPSKLIELEQYSSMTIDGTTSIEVVYDYIDGEFTTYEFIIVDQELIEKLMTEVYEMELKEYPEDRDIDFYQRWIIVHQDDVDYHINLCFNSDENGNRYLYKSHNLFGIIEKYIEDNLIK